MTRSAGTGSRCSHTLLAEFSTIADFSEIVHAIEHEEKKSDEEICLFLRRRNGRRRRKDEGYCSAARAPGLAEMSRAGVPVPPGFTISTEVCNIYFQNNNQTSRRTVEAQMLEALDDARRSAWARSWATPTNPLLVSVRSGAKFSMPGMMDTILNLGLNDETVEGAARPRRATRASPTTATAASSRCSATWCWSIAKDEFEHVFDARKKQGEGEARHRPDRRGPARRSSRSTRRWSRRRPASRFPQDATRAAGHGAATPCSAPGGNQRAIHYRKMNKIPDDLGTAVQRADDGVRQHGRHLRHRRGLHPQPRHRREGFYGEFLVNAQGEDVVAGIRTPHADQRTRRPGMPDGLQAAARDHHAAWRSTTGTCRTSSSPCRTASCTCCRPATASAPVRRRCAIAVEMVEEGLIGKEEAVLRVDPQQLDQLAAPGARPSLEEEADRASPRACRRRPARPSASIVFTAEDAVEKAAKKAPGHPGPQGDHAGRHPRHGSGQGHSDRARRHDQPRGGGGPRHGHPCVAGAEAHRSQRAREAR